MRWSYKTVHFSLKKEGLLGSAFIDENEIEVSLNEYGKLGWELVSFMEVNDGLIAVFKQPFAQGLARLTGDGQVAEQLESKEKKEPEDVVAILGQESLPTTGLVIGRKEPPEISPIEDLSESPATAKRDGGASAADVGSIRIL